jgi:phosphopantothenoylcysteine decarboxylase/phosphopantothenate--cysteine ligase
MPAIALGVSSSISIYKACEVLRGFQKAGWAVQPILTPNAARLVSPLLFSTLSGRRTIVETFDGDHDWSVAHVALAKEIDLFVVAPATANILAKFAHGVADDFLSTFYLAVRKPILIAPAMNTAMWRHPQTISNVRLLRGRGVEFVEPASGYLACGEEGEGRLAEPELIVEQGLEIMRRARSLSDRTVLITAGPTREYLDPVRYLSNRSSGRMGFAMAAEAAARGARVILVCGPTPLDPPSGAEIVRVVTSAEMAEAVRARFDEAEIVVMSAAVADFTFPAAAGRKIKKNEMGDSIALVPTVDILMEAGVRKAGRYLVGFAAETEDVRRHALLKLKEKNLDLIVANDVSAEGIGFDSDFNRVCLIDADGGEAETPVLSKIEISRIIWNHIERHAVPKS